MNNIHAYIQYYVIACLYVLTHVADWLSLPSSFPHTLQVWSLDRGERLLTLRSHTDGVTCVQFNDKVIVSGSYDKTVKLWDFSAC